MQRDPMASVVMMRLMRCETNEETCLIWLHFYPIKLCAHELFPSIAKKEHVRALVLSRKCDQTNPVQLDRPCD